MNLKTFLIQMLTNPMIGKKIWMVNGRLLLFQILFVNLLQDVEYGKDHKLIIHYIRGNGLLPSSIIPITRENGSQRKYQIPTTFTIPCLSK